MDVEQTAAEFRQRYELLSAEVSKVIVGSEEIIDGVLTGLFAGGHCLLEGVPGLGKTMLVRTLSEALHLPFSRIQFTPDLMPADIIGTNMIVEDEHGAREFQFRAGPIFANVVLADEINRATPKTQSALLEAMQEHTVTVGRTMHRLDEPFFVLATQNPIEMEGTYPLPEAQMDRFLF
ncbi:MAG: AAA domain-containing protein, partial [Nitrospiraceae bacterium]|nr:AAA domain-containing protein [Nitrospiraceae bacterium]